MTEDTPRPIREIVETVPEWLCSVIEKLHAKNPADRFTSAKAVAEAVDKAEANDLPRLVRVASAKDVTRRMAPSSKVIFWVVFVILASLSAPILMVLGYFFSSSVTEKQISPTALTKLDTPEILEGEEFLAFPRGDTPSEKIVYYKTPFSSPPYLTFPNGLTYGYVVTEQKADSFKLQRKVAKEVIPGEIKPGVQTGTAPPQSLFAESKLKWKAEGRPQDVTLGNRAQLDLLSR